MSRNAGLTTAYSNLGSKAKDWHQLSLSNQDGPKRAGTIKFNSTFMSFSLGKK